MLKFLAETWGQKLVLDMQPFVLAIFAVIGSVATGYAIFLGTMLAKAEDESKRQQAKSRIVKTVVGLFILFFLSGFFIPIFNGVPLLYHFLDGIEDNSRTCIACGKSEHDCTCPGGPTFDIRKGLSSHSISVTLDESGAVPVVTIYQT